MKGRSNRRKKGGRSNDTKKRVFTSEIPIPGNIHVEILVIEINTAVRKIITVTVYVAPQTCAHNWEEYNELADNTIQDLKSLQFK